MSMEPDAKGGGPYKGALESASDSDEVRAGWPTFACRTSTPRSVRRWPPSLTFNDFIFGGLLAGLAWVPIWFGSNSSLAWAVNAIYFCGLVAVLEARLVATRRRHEVSVWRVAPAAVAVGAACVCCVVQAATWVPEPLVHPVWRLAADALGFNVAASISIDRDATGLALLRLITAASAFWLALQLCRSAQRARRLIEATALIGLAYATYGIVAFFLFPHALLWLEKTHYTGSLTATFVNRNTYATYAAIGLVCAVTLLVREVVRGPGLSNDPLRKLANLVAGMAGRAGLWLAAAFVIALALFLTGSRGGVVAALVGVVLALGLGLRRYGSNRSVAAAASLIGVVMIAGVALTFGDALAGRIEAYGLRSDDRLGVYRVVLSSIADRPIVGFGYGTFAQTFPMYRDAGISPFGVWDKAHNSALEIVQGLGVPVAVIFMAGLGSLWWRCFQGAFARKHLASAPIAASAATVVVVAHSFVDFSLQIQAVTLTWVALLGAGVAQSWPGGTDTRA
jgi:O-antigen ligase